MQIGPALAGQLASESGRVTGAYSLSLTPLERGNPDPCESIDRVDERLMQESVCGEDLRPVQKIGAPCEVGHSTPGLLD